MHAVILSDYGKGVLSNAVCSELILNCRKEEISVLVDPKGKEWSRYQGATCITPNLAELQLLADSYINNDDDLTNLAARVCETFQFEHLLITMGARGMALVGRNLHPILIPAQPREVFDVSGAGDTVIATLAAGIGAGLTWIEAAKLANMAAGLVVVKLGTQPVRIDELRLAVRLGEQGFSHKLCSLAEARMRIESWHVKGESVVFTNGCFDLLHVGHIQLLHAAVKQGSRLVVGVNSDESVRRLKGPGKPIISQEDRVSILAALECVDMVIVFEDDTPLELIRVLRPDVLVKGADYTKEAVVGYREVESWGGKVVIIPLLEGSSTTSIVELIANNMAR